MNTRNENRKQYIELNIGDQLTSVSCGHIVAEMIKFFAYQRLQIPYTYPWFKQLIRNKVEIERESFDSQRHFCFASIALKNLDDMIKSLSEEINSAITPREICVAFGATPVTYKEMYRFLLPSLYHKPQCQSVNIANDQKIQKDVFRVLATSEQLSKVFATPLPPTNMYIFMKTRLIRNQDIIYGHDFVLIRSYRLPRNCNVVNINFRTQNTVNFQCCNNLPVFSELSQNLHQLNIEDNNDNDDDFDEIESSDDVKWFQSTHVMKGFKDCVVNGYSVTNSWTNSSS